MTSNLGMNRRNPTLTQPVEHWTVLPHGKPVQVDEDILTVVGEIHMPLMDLPRQSAAQQMTGRASG